MDGVIFTIEHVLSSLMTFVRRESNRCDDRGPVAPVRAGADPPKLCKRSRVRATLSLQFLRDRKRPTLSHDVIGDCVVDRVKVRLAIINDAGSIIFKQEGIDSIDCWPTQCIHDESKLGTIVVRVTR